MNYTRYISVLLISIVVLVSHARAADDKEPDKNSATAETIDTEGLTSPRETMQTFLKGMEDTKEHNSEQIKNAIKTLDLSDINALVRFEKGRDIAWTLSEVLARTKQINVSRIPSRKTGKPYVVSKFDIGNIVIALKPDGRWLFDAQTVDVLPAILDEMADVKRRKDTQEQAQYLPWNLRLRGILPESFKDRWFLIENWQWLGILLFIAFGFVSAKLTTLFLTITIRRWRAGGFTLEFWLISDDWLRPVGLLVMAGIWWIGLSMLGLPAEALVILLVAVKIFAGIAGVWSAYRIVDLVTAYLEKHARKTATKVDDVLVPLMRKTLKVFITVIGFLFVASNLNLNITGLVAGVGLGGLAFALAAKDLVQNLFGSVTVLLDQSFHVGDWIVIGDVEGTVEEVGLRSTRIRTFYNSVITMPNSRLITASVDNLGVRKYRRMKCKISLTYDTPPEAIEIFCESVRELVRLHPYMRKDYFHVYLTDLGQSSLDVLVYVFWQTPDWSTELREKHRFLLDILRVAERLGVDFAFPTQTIHWKPVESEADSTAKVSRGYDHVKTLEEARNAAKQVVQDSTGINVKPPPVTFD